MPDAVPCTLTLLGAFQLTRADGSVALSAGKPLALLAYVACARHRRASRASVADLLWGDSAESSRRASLRQALFVLRNTLGAAAVTSDGEWLEVSDTIRLDVDDFVQAVEARDYRAAVEAYAGDFVAGFAAPGAAEFERWADTERLRLHGVFVAAMSQLLQQLVDHGELADAVALSRRLIDAAPHNDAAWRRRFDVLALAGQTGPLLLEVESLKAMRAEQDEPLDPQLERDLERLIGAVRNRSTDAAAEGAPAGIPSSPEFQVRSEAFGTLLAAWAKAREGQPQRLLVVGQAALGKSRLLQELARRVARRRVRIVTIGAQQRERDDAYALLGDLVAALARLPGAAGIAPASARVLNAVVPEFGVTIGTSVETVEEDGADVPLRRARALVDLLGAVTEENPVVVLVDDLHWADDASVKALELALARIERMPLLLVASSRYAAPDLGCGEARIELRPLEESETRALVASIADLATDAPASLVTLVHRTAGGSPLGVLRILRAAVAAGALRIDGGQWVVASAEQLAEVCTEADSSAGRMRHLAPVERDALGVLAVANTAIDETQLLALLPDADEGRAALAHLERQGLVHRDARRRWDIGHALIADDVRALLDGTTYGVIAGRLGKGLLSEAQDFASLRRAIRLLLEGNETTAAIEGAIAWHAAHAPLPFTPRGYVEALLGGRAHPAFREATLRRLYRRQAWWRKPSVVATASVLFTMGLVWWVLTAPARLVLTSEIEPAGVEQSEVPYEVPPASKCTTGLARSHDAETGKRSA